jgi:ABC-2 type transport system ATP-binding protein
MIEATNLSKRYGDKTAVNHVSFTVEPGRVTGFLGPNGAGKSTTMRLILGLDRPNSGSATIDGRRYRDLAEPLRVVGALLEAKAVHRGRTAYNHLLVLAQTQGIARSRVDEVIDLVGLHDVARRRAGNFSLGMGQRLGLAAALLGDPQVLILDEPVNGLDPEGILWIRNLLKFLASQGRTIFVSSHLMSEMALTADHLLVIGHGEILADCTTHEFIDRHSEQTVLVRSPDSDKLRDLLTSEGARVVDGAEQVFTVLDLPAPRIGELAAHHGVVLHELTPQRGSLEDAFMELTRDSVEYAAATTPGPDVHETPIDAQEGAR